MPADPSDPLVAVTPHRQTRVELGGPQWIVYHHEWKYVREADQFRLSGLEQASNQADSHDVFYLPGAGWILEPVLLSQSRANLTANSFQFYSGNEEGNLAPNVRSYDRWRKDTDLSGVTWSSDLAGTGLPAYEKLAAAGNNYAISNTADAFSFPGPTDPQIVNLSRVFSGIKTERAGRSLLFSFWMPAGADTGETVYRFYFGGPTDMLPRTKRGGEWCLAFRGDGRMVLWARIDAEWQRQGTYTWSDQISGRGGWAHCLILPFSSNRIYFVTQQGTGARGGQGRLGATKLPGRAESLNISVHRHVGAMAGFTFKGGLTGPGPVRVDCRGDLACRFAIGSSGYATSGQLIDAPFALPRVVPAGSVLRVKPRYTTPESTVVIPALYDADTGSALELGPDPFSYLTNEGQKRYFAGMSLSGFGDRTPVVQDYEVILDASVSEARQDEDPLVVPEVGPTAVQILGQDQDPTHWSGELEVHDLKREYTPLGVRGRVPIRIWTTFAAPQPPLVFETCIFEGECTAEHEEVYLAEPGGWHYPRYEVRMLGQWAKVIRQKATDPWRYGWDTDKDQPLTVTATIRQLLGAAGVQEADIDVPEIALPYFAPDLDGGGHPYQLAQGAAFLERAIKLARDYHDGWIVYDPNAGTRGMWRLRLNPARPDQNILWNFVTSVPEVTGLNGLPAAHAVHVFDSYPEKTSFCRVLKTKRQPPEFNSVKVQGKTPGPTNETLIAAHKHNPNAFTADPAHPTADPTSLDYFDGQEVNEKFFDPGIQTQEHANWLAYRYLQLGGRGRELKMLEAPFYPVTDPLDTKQTRPRPLMTGDAVTIDGAVGVVRNTNLYWNDDVCQWQRVEVAMVRLEGNLES